MESSLNLKTNPKRANTNSILTFSDSLFSSLLEEPIIDVDGLGATNEGVLELEGLVTDVAAAAAAVEGAVDDEGVAAAAAAWLDLEPRSLAQLNLRPQLPFLDLLPGVVDDDEFEPELPLPLLLFAWLAQLELRQHLHTRDFLPDDVSELSSVAAVDVDVAGGAIVLVVVVSSGCRQHVEEDNDVVAPVAAAFGAAAVADDTVFVDSGESKREKERKEKSY